MKVETIENGINTIPEFNIESNYLILNGQRTNQQVITQDQRFCACLDGKYHILANELITEHLESLAKETGLVPLNMSDQNWFHKKPLGQYIYKNKYGATTKSFWLLTEPEPRTFPDGSEYFYGVMLKNSIDGAWSFRANAFDYRQICGNAIPHLARERQVVASQERIEQAMETGNIGGQTLNVASVYKRHTQSLDLGTAIETIRSVIESGREFNVKWQELWKLKIDKKDALWVATHMPKWVTDAENHNSGEMSVGDIIQINKDKVDFKEGTSKFALHNALTNALTHEGKTFTTTLTNFQKVDAHFFGRI